MKCSIPFMPVILLASAIAVADPVIVSVQFGVHSSHITRSVECLTTSPVGGRGSAAEEQKSSMERMCLELTLPLSYYKEC